MQLALEFLQTDADIEEFIDYLYEHNFHISYRCRKKQHIELNQINAVHVLQHDLYTIWGAYYIGDTTHSKILMLDSCGPQAHPSKLGRQGRYAGRIAHIDKNNAVEKELMRLIRNYFRRNYQFLRYNGAARMNCHFGPHYLRMEADYFANPQSSHLCVGFLHILCHPGRVEHEMEMVAGTLERMDIQNMQISVRQYWGHPALSELHIPFLYNAASFSVESYFSTVSMLSFSNSSVRFYSESVAVGFKNCFSSDELLHHPEANCVDLLLQRPWSSWI